jgi:polyhydroxybutyrate depolymerase
MSHAGHCHLRQLLFFIVAALLVAGVGSATRAAEQTPAIKNWTIDGVERTALVYIPPIAATAPAPVVFAFHGHGGNMENSERKFAYHKTWPEAIVVYMQGLPSPGRYDPEGKTPGWQKNFGDQNDRDLKFFDTVLASLKQSCKVDEKRIYATGHSNGGGFTYLLWAARPDVFAAIAPSAGGAAALRSAKNINPIPVLCVAGEHDTNVPFAAQLKIMEAIRKNNNCETVGKPWASVGTLVGTIYASKTGTPVISAIHPGTHIFPLKAPELITKFFKENARK